MNKKIGVSAVLAALAAMQAPAYALDTGVEWLQVKGFGSLVASHANVDGGNGYYQPDLTANRGIDDSWSVGTDSRIGIQADARINSALSATVQLLSARNEKGNYTPEVMWGNLKYQFTPDVSVRLGRVGLAAFLISDYQFVGYSQPWVRPPAETYRLMPSKHVDGIDGSVRFHQGDSTITVQGTYGKSDFKAVLNGGLVTDWDVDDVLALNVTYETGPWTLRYGKIYGKNKNSVFIPGESINDNFNNLGLIFDQNNWLVQAEYIWRKTNSVSGFGVNDAKMGYLTAGYRFGKVMPMVNYSRFVDHSDTGSLQTSQVTKGVGVRWDFYKNVALKAQWDHVTRPAAALVGYTGTFNTAPWSPLASDNKSVNVVSVGLDFVF